MRSILKNNTSLLRGSLSGGKERRTIFPLRRHKSSRNGWWSACGSSDPLCSSSYSRCAASFITRASHDPKLPVVQLHNQQANLRLNAIVAVFHKQSRGVGNVRVLGVSARRECTTQELTQPTGDPSGPGGWGGGKNWGKSSASCLTSSPAASSC